MNDIAEQIHSKLIILLQEQHKFEQKILSLQRDESHLKSDLHNTELKLIHDSSTDSESSSKIVLDHIKELTHERDSIKIDEKRLSDLKQQLIKCTKNISTHSFWMKYADTTDTHKQAEAKKKIPGL